jgi:hypothetical protein
MKVCFVFVDKTLLCTSVTMQDAMHVHIIENNILCVCVCKMWLQSSHVIVRECIK